jgi:integrase
MYYEREINLDYIIEYFEGGLEMLYKLKGIEQANEMAIPFENFVDDISLKNNQGDENDMSKKYEIKEGTFFKRADGRWEGRLTLEGKQISVCCCKDKDKAYSKLKASIKKKNNGQLKRQHSSKSKYTLYSWLKDWSEIYKKPTQKEKTYKELLSNIRNHIKTNIEDTRLDKISTIEIQKCLNKLQTERLKESIYIIFNACFKKAVQLKYIKENYCDAIEKPKPKRNNGEALTVEREKRFIIEANKSEYGNIFIYYLLTGSRLSEALLARWSDIDFENKIFTIRGTKNESSKVRKIPLFDKLEELLKNIRKNQKKPTEKIFNISLSTIKREFKKIQDNLDFKINIHMLRHTFATRCMESDIPLTVVKKWLGHSRITTTEKIYTHVMTDFEREQGNKFATNFATNFDGKNKKDT